MTNRSKSRLAFVVLTLVFSLGNSAFADKKKDRQQKDGSNNARTEWVTTPPTQTGPGNFLTYFLENELGVETITDFDLTEKTKDLEPQFSPDSKAALQHIFDSVIQSAYPNAALLGMPGIGKTFLNNQLAFVFSRGQFPEYYKDALHAGNPFFEKQFKAFIGNTRVIVVNNDLLNRHLKSEENHAFNKPEDRQAAVLQGLCKEAEKEFKKSGQRTIFLMDEVGTLPQGLQNVLKSLTDKTGWQDPADIDAAKRDVGFHFVVSTTPYEFQKMEAADGAIRRRYNIFNMLEISEKSALDIIIDKADKLKSRHGGLEVEVDALTYIIKMRNLFDLTPTAMPASVLRALEGLYPWAAGQPQTTIDGKITLAMAQKFVNYKLGLSDIWLSGPNGEPPLAGLSEKVKKIVKGQDYVVDQIAKIIKTWARGGMDGPVPVILLGGSSGSGKDTIYEAFNRVLFGHDGQAMKFSIGGAQDFAIDSLINGPPLGNHSDAKLPTIIQQMLNGNANSLIALNEAKDCSGEELEKLKVALERGYMQSMGIDPRPYRFRFPIFIMGQWGEEAFFDKSDDQIRELVSKMTQKEIDSFFIDPVHLNPDKSPKLGKVARALLQRAKVYGGVFMLAPVLKDFYGPIVDNEIAKIKKEKTVTNNISVETTPELTALVVSNTVGMGEDTRGLKGRAYDFVWGAVSAAMDKGLPSSNVSVKISAQDGKIVVQQLDKDSKEVANFAFTTAELSRAKSAATICGDSILLK